ncbi:tail length tape measure protein [Rhizoctonia solani AG-1 IB]|uniref:Tail length tape measure protein n=1 Tax=Thanatephorus cucumeris (strain AG1-IB / isolate 7/3/14) TaxID=1108050 RepID=A0A0B7FQP7_THACB|nr:tail length tape measure protein [Rhizoctonia solani AG-1 IB]
MPRSTFRRIEVDFLETYIPSWRELKGNAGDKIDQSTRLNARSLHVCKVVREFLAKFQDRDPTFSDPSPITFTQEEVSDLGRRICQWLNNNTRSNIGQATAKKQALKGRIHARNLATQRYHQEINEMARKLKSDQPGIHQMAAFNQATTNFMVELEQADPERYQKLFLDAESIRSAGSKDYSELAPEVIAKLLADFPKRFLDKIEAHGRSLPVHIWCIVAYTTPPDDEVQRMFTPSLNQIDGSPTNKKMKKLFMDWLQNTLGVSAVGSIEHAAPTVYPDPTRSFRPCLPAVSDVKKVSAHQLRAWLRTYFNYMRMWQGGSGPLGWKEISQDTSFRYIPKACFPPGVSKLLSPHDMSRTELEAWYSWIISGQEGRLQPHQNFRFSIVERGKDLPPLEFPEPIVAAPVNSQLTWTVEEKLYAYKVCKIAEDSLTGLHWDGLPLARTQDVFQPLSATLQTQLSNACAPEYWTSVVISMLFEYEQYGPVHVSLIHAHSNGTNALQTQDLGSKEPLSSYIDPSMSDIAFNSFLGEASFRVAALLEDHPSYPDYALSTFIHWAKTNTRLRHSQSNTWRAGPAGVRWIGGIYAHFACAFTLFETGIDILPTEVRQAFSLVNFSRLKSLLIAFGSWLEASINKSIAILRHTFKERAGAWRTAVVSAYLAYAEDDAGNESLAFDTHRIPQTRAGLQQCYEMLEDTDPHVTLGANNDEFRDVQRRFRRMARELEDELSDRDSTSGEEIQMPDLGSQSDSNSSSKTSMFHMHAELLIQRNHDY